MNTTYINVTNKNSKYLTKKKSKYSC